MNGAWCLVSHLHAQLPVARGDAEGLVSELPRQVEGLAWRLLQREPRRVLLHRGLHRRPHLRRRAKVPVRGHQPRDALVRPPEVVAVDEEAQPPHAVVEVGKHRTRQEFIPQCLPEALRLPQRLWVVRAALQVLNVVALQLLLELRRPSPGRVLPTVVGQHLARWSEGRHPALEGLHHQRRLLVVRHGVAHDEAAVVVHENGDVQALMLPQEEGEDVRLPELVRLRALEARLGPRRLLCLWRPRVEQALLVKNPPHGALRHPDALEAPQDVSDAPSAVMRCFFLRLHDKAAPRVDARRGATRSRLRRRQRRLSAHPEGPQPQMDGGLRHAEDALDVSHRRLLFKHFAQHPQPELRRVAIHPSLLSSLCHRRLLRTCQASKGVRR